MRFRHTQNDGIHLRLVLLQERCAKLGQGAEFLTVLFDRLDELVAVARLLRDQMQQHEAQFAMIEQLTTAAAAMALEACAVPIAAPAKQTEIVPVLGGTREMAFAMMM